MNDRTENPKNLTIAYQSVEMEMGAIWSRYNALLVAVSVLGAVTAQIFVSGKNDIPIIILSAAATLICIFWATIHFQGYINFSRKIEIAKKFEENSTYPSRYIKENIYDGIFKSSLLVILTFAFLFILLMLYKIFLVLCEKL